MNQLPMIRLLAFSVWTLITVHTVSAEELRGKVVSIADGDTITVLDSAKVQHRVRLEGIDAPEKAQAFGSKSKDKLSELIGKNDVLVTWKEKDRYGRILGDVYVENRHINLEMIKEGMAWHYKQYSKSKELSAAEEQAKRAKKGLWADKEPVPPWDFRSSKRK